MASTSFIHPKVKAGTSTAAVVAVVVSALALVGVDIPPAVSDAVVVLAGFVGGYVKGA